ncbi:MAG: TraR/DksA C4-type zinc finger protein [Myxococcota bacterium]
MTLRMHDHERKLVEEIRAALRRVDEGEYGICEACGDDIGERRLMARPMATHCIDCMTEPRVVGTARHADVLTVDAEPGRGAPYVRVAVARPLLAELTYGCRRPSERSTWAVVLVPLGGQAETGYVVATAAEPDLDPAKIKPVSRVLDPLPAFDDEQLAFFRWIADYYLAPLGMVIQTALPSAIRAKVVRVAVPTDDGTIALTTKPEEGPPVQLLREVVSRPGLTRRGPAASPGQRPRGPTRSTARSTPPSAAAGSTGRTASCTRARAWSAPSPARRAPTPPPPAAPA